MANVIKKFDIGLGLVPQSADPSSPVEGQLQYADGTARSEGVWVYKNGSWSELAAADTTTAIYTTNAGQSISNASTTIVDFEDSIVSHANVTTGASWKFTASETANYLVDARVTVSSISTFDTSEVLRILLYKNGALHIGNALVFSFTGANNIYSLSVSGIVPLTSTDYIDIRIFQNSGSSVSLTTISEYNRINIRKV